MSSTTRVFAGLAFSALAVLAPGPVAGQARIDDAAWLADTLNAVSGSVVADVGAGVGEISVALAEHVGPSGTVYATELGTESVAELRSFVDSAGGPNVRVVEGHPLRTNLPPSCCDGMLLRGVYHHFTDPTRMNASLLESLKPGGRLAVIDFEPDGEESTDPAGRGAGDQHGITVETLQRELESAGFVVLSAEVVPPFSGIYLVAEKPRFR